jgi:hypothetical protein
MTWEPVRQPDRPGGGSSFLVVDSTATPPHSVRHRHVRPKRPCSVLHVVSIAPFLHPNPEFHISIFASPFLLHLVIPPMHGARGKARSAKLSPANCQYVPTTSKSRLSLPSETPAQALQSVPPFTLPTTVAAVEAISALTVLPSWFWLIHAGSTYHTYQGGRAPSATCHPSYFPRTSTTGSPLSSGES